MYTKEEFVVMYPTFATSMQKPSVTCYPLKHRLYSVLMILSLLWLTVSLPFVFAAQSARAAAEQQHIADEECSNSFANTTEEKTSNNSNTLSEYLHDLPSCYSGDSVSVVYEKCHPSDLYFAFHPDLFSPPPEA